MPNARLMNFDESEYECCDEALKMGLTCIQPDSVSFQMMTVLSKEAEARRVPNLGCAQETCQTAASWPINCVNNRCVSEATSKIRIVRSEDAVANRRP